MIRKHFFFWWLRVFFFQPRAPVVTRACYLLECAYYVHQCNRGHWPSWLKMNLPSGGSRPSRGTSLIHTQPLATRRSISMQLQASKMFHQWGEVRFLFFFLLAPLLLLLIFCRAVLNASLFKSSRKYKGVKGISYIISRISDISHSVLFTKK